MRRFRFNIASLLVIVLFVAVGFAALRESTDLWESGVFILAIGVLLTSILLDVHRTESRRAYWIGFAVFGWIYLALTLVPSIGSRLITTQAFAYLNSGVRNAFSNTVQGGGTFSGNLKEHTIKAPFQGIILKSRKQRGSLTSYYSAFFGGGSGKTRNSVGIGHSLFTLLMGWLGAQFSRRLYRSARSSEPSSVVNVEGNNP
jgi:hypothetical protein